MHPKVLLQQHVPAGNRVSLWRNYKWCNSLLRSALLMVLCGVCVRTGPGVVTDYCTCYCCLCELCCGIPLLLDTSRSKPGYSFNRCRAGQTLQCCRVSAVCRSVCSAYPGGVPVSYIQATLVVTGSVWSLQALQL